MKSLVFSLGIDFGTSGARAVVLNGAAEATQIVAQVACRFDEEGEWRSDETKTWERVLYRLIGKIPLAVRDRIGRVAINGTSATMMLSDQQGQPLTKPLMYNDAIARTAMSEVKTLVPSESPALSATSTLTKAIWLYRHGCHGGDEVLSRIVCDRNSVYITHQADWLACLLHRQHPVTDYHNALKLGYDVKALAYPDRLLKSPVASWLPEVVAPGEAIATIDPEVAKNISMPSTCQICAGTTDSIAAFLASGVQNPGEAVTSLGSTLVLKLLSTQPIDHQESGIYSHRLGDLWLAGGASNTGGAVLNQFFSSKQLAALSQEISQQIDISTPSPYEYYPLTAPGERFPINDPDHAPKLTPRPEADSDFLYGMLEAMARIEAQGYQKLNELGAADLKQVYTAGGGAKNKIWQTVRQRRLGVFVSAANQTEAAYGTAQLAMFGLSRFAQQ